MLGEHPNQIGRKRDDVVPNAGALVDLAGTPGGVTEAGLRSNISIGFQYISFWLGGRGAVAPEQPDGGRRDGGDLPQPDLAVDPQRDETRGRDRDRPRDGRAHPRRGDGADPRRGSARTPGRPAGLRRRGRSSRRSRSVTTSPTSSPKWPTSCSTEAVARRRSGAAAAESRRGGARSATPPRRRRAGRRSRRSPGAARGSGSSVRRRR